MNLVDFYILLQGSGGLQRSADSSGMPRSLMNMQTGQDSGDRKRHYGDEEMSDRSGPYRYDRERSRDGFGSNEPPSKRMHGGTDSRRGQTDYQDDRWKSQGSYRNSDQYSRGNDRRNDSDRNFGYGARDYDSERRESTSDSYRGGAGREEVNRDFFGGAPDRRDIDKQSYGRDTYDNRGMDKHGRDWYSDSGEASRDTYRSEPVDDFHKDRPTDARRDGQDYYSSQRDQYQDYGRGSTQFSQYRSDYRREVSGEDDYSMNSAYQRSQEIDRGREMGSISDARGPYQDRADYSMSSRGDERQSADYRTERYGQGRASDGRSLSDTSRYDSRGYDHAQPRSMDQKYAGSGR